MQVISKMNSFREPRHLLELPAEERKAFLNSFDYVFSDCDGVVWKLMEPIPHTGKAINLLKSAGKQVKFVSNNAFTSDEKYLEQFRCIGAENVQTEDIVHPIKAIIKYLQQHKPGERVFSIASREANQMMRDSGIEVETLQVYENVTTINLMELLNLTPNVGAVIFDINFNINYMQITKAIYYLKTLNCILLSGGSDNLIPFTQNYFIPGFTDFLTFITKFSSKQTMAFGKPTIRLGEHLKEMFEVKDARRCLFIGDTLTQDILFGKNCGFQTLLVLSGVATQQEMLSTAEQLRPDFYANGLTDFIEFFRITQNEKKEIN